jgi:hypothetical protein
MNNFSAYSKSNKQWKLFKKRVPFVPIPPIEPPTIYEVSLGEQTHMDISTIADSLQSIAKALNVIAGVDTND